MGKAHKFTFDTVFDEGGTVLASDSGRRQRKSMTQSELDAMLAVARDDGQRAGAMQAVASAAGDVAAAVHRVIETLDVEIASIRAEAVELALIAARKLAGAALGAAPEAEVEAVFRAAMHQAIGEPRIVLRAAPEVADKLSERAAEIAHQEGFEGRVIVAADAGRAGADCRIEWRGGGAERNAQAIEQALSALVLRRFSPETSLPANGE